MKSDLLTIFKDVSNAFKDPQAATAITPPSFTGTVGIELLETLYANLYLEYLAASSQLMSALGLSTGSTLATINEAVESYIWDNFNVEGLSGTSFNDMKKITKQKLTDMQSTAFNTFINDVNAIVFTLNEE